MTRILLAAMTGALMSLAASAALAQSAEPAKISDTAKGKILVDAKGMTLYTLDRDTTADKSTCNGQCATNWPPLPVAATAANTGNWTIVIRDDGSKQWAYKGKPLYYWKDDKAPGETSGDGRNNVWHVALP
jgi:predicted lipoprotein with Yx(FWY)xxD motif